MAIYHLEAKVVSRGTGRSAVAASAYLSCSRLYNDYDGIQHDYTKKQGLVWQEVFLPEYAPQEWQDREKLWNAVEEVETATDSRLAREFVVALPIELKCDEQIELLQEFIREQFVSDGMCADAAIHDTDGHNPHAHILLTEDLEELRSEKSLLLQKFEYAEDAGAEAFHKDIATMEASLKKLEAQEQKYSVELDKALTEYAELKAQTADFDPVELYEARQAIRPVQEKAAERQLEDAMHEKPSIVMLLSAKQETSRLLRENMEYSLLRRRKQEQQQKKAGQYARNSKERER